MRPILLEGVTKAVGNCNYWYTHGSGKDNFCPISVHYGKLYQSDDRGTSWTSDGSIDRVGIGATGSSLCPQVTFSSVGLSRCMPCDIGTSTRGSGTAGSDQIVCDVCDSGFSGISSIISLIDIRHNNGIDTGDKAICVREVGALVGFLLHTQSPITEYNFDDYLAERCPDLRHRQFSLSGRLAN